MAFLLFSACVLGGFGLMVWSWMERRRKNLLAGVEEGPLGEMELGRACAVSGVADAPALLNSPVTQTPCVFYEKQVDVQATLGPEADGSANAVDMGLTLAGKLAWVRESIERAGGFYLSNGNAKIFVLPRGATLRIDGEHQNSLQDPNSATTRRITERFIPRGQTVCVVGRPRNIEAMIAALRDQEGASMGSETLRMVLEEGRKGSLPCFFDDGGGTFIVADMAFSDLQADAAESVSTLFWAGLALLGMGVFIMVAAAFRLI